MGRKKKSAIASREEVLEMFTSIMRGEIPDCTTRRSGGGEEPMTIPPKLSERSHAAELLSKHYGLFSDKSELPADKTPIAGEIEAFAQRLFDGEAKA